METSASFEARSSAIVLRDPGVNGTGVVFFGRHLKLRQRVKKLTALLIGQRRPQRAPGADSRMP